MNSLFAGTAALVVVGYVAYSFWRGRLVRPAITNKCQPFDDSRFVNRSKYHLLTASGGHRWN